MNGESGKVIIFLYNLYTLILIPALFVLDGFWRLEAEISKGSITHGPILVLLIFLPEVVMSLELKLKLQYRNRVVPSILSIAAAFLLIRLFRYLFLVKTHAPITYNCCMGLMLLGLVWSFFMEWNEDLREHLLKYPKGQWFVPNDEDETKNHIWQGLWAWLFTPASLFMIYIAWFYLR